MILARSYWLCTLIEFHHPGDDLEDEVEQWNYSDGVEAVHYDFVICLAWRWGYLLCRHFRPAGQRNYSGLK